MSCPVEFAKNSFEALCKKLGTEVLLTSNSSLLIPSQAELRLGRSSVLQSVGNLRTELNHAEFSNDPAEVPEKASEQIASDSVMGSLQPSEEDSDSGSHEETEAEVENQAAASNSDQTKPDVIRDSDTEAETTTSKSHSIDQEEPVDTVYQQDKGTGQSEDFATEESDENTVEVEPLQNGMSESQRREKLEADFNLLDRPGEM